MPRFEPLTGRGIHRGLQMTALQRVRGDAVALAKELKVSLPTMYSTLKRAGWKGRRSRAA
jgi:hypothetical protein